MKSRVKNVVICPELQTYREWHEQDLSLLLFAIVRAGLMIPLVSQLDFQNLPWNIPFNTNRALGSLTLVPMNSQRATGSNFVDAEPHARD